MERDRLVGEIDPRAGIRIRRLDRVAGLAGLLSALVGHRAGFRLVSSD